MHLVGCLYYLYQWCTVKQISGNEIYLLVKYIKRVLWRVAKRLTCIEDARCLKVNETAIYLAVIIGFLGNLWSRSSVIMVIFTSTLKMKTDNYSETFVSVYQTTRHHIVPEHNHRSWSVLLGCCTFCGFTACYERLYLCSVSDRTLVLDWHVSEQTMLIHFSDRAMVIKVRSAGAVGIREISFGFVIEVRRQKYCIHFS